MALSQFTFVFRQQESAKLAELILCAEYVQHEFRKRDSFFTIDITYDEDHNFIKIVNIRSYAEPLIPIAQRLLINLITDLGSTQQY